MMGDDLEARKRVHNEGCAKLSTRHCTGVLALSAQRRVQFRLFQGAPRVIVSACIILLRVVGCVRHTGNVSELSQCCVCEYPSSDNPVVQ